MTAFWAQAGVAPAASVASASTAPAANRIGLMRKSMQNLNR